MAHVLHWPVAQHLPVTAMPTQQPLVSCTEKSAHPPFHLDCCQINEDHPSLLRGPTRSRPRGVRAVEGPSILGKLPDSLLDQGPSRAQSCLLEPAAARTELTERGTFSNPTAAGPEYAWYSDHGCYPAVHHRFALRAAATSAGTDFILCIVSPFPNNSWETCSPFHMPIPLKQRGHLLPKFVPLPQQRGIFEGTGWEVWQKVSKWTVHCTSHQRDFSYYYCSCNQDWVQLLYFSSHSKVSYINSRLSWRVALWLAHWPESNTGVDTLRMALLMSYKVLTSETKGMMTCLVLGNERSLRSLPSLLFWECAWVVFLPSILIREKGDENTNNSGEASGCACPQ